MSEYRRDLALWWMDKTQEERERYPQWYIDRYDDLCCRYLNKADSLEWARRGADALWGERR